MNEELKKRFEYRELTVDQIDLTEELRKRFIDLAQFVDFNCPVSREKSICLTELETAMFYANSSVSRYS